MTLTWISSGQWGYPIPFGVHVWCSTPQLFKFSIPGRFETEPMSNTEAKRWPLYHTMVVYAVDEWQLF